MNAERSGLFFQAVRIIKEMRCATNGRYPRFAVWENVAGAFSSNGGEDFRCVLEELCKVKDPDISVPKPAKWEKAGEIVGKDFSLAYRTVDAQYWGVPQRRMRIYLVADFTGASASKILFESEGVSGYSAESFRTWQEASRSFGDCSQETGSGLMFENHSQDTRYTGPIEVAQTVSATYGTGGNNSLGLSDTELKQIVTDWREASPHITDLWWSVDKAVKKAIKEKTTPDTHGLTFSYESGFLFIKLPSGRRLAYERRTCGY